MRPFDQSARYAALTEPGFVLARLAPLIGLPLTFRRWFPTRTVPLPGGPDRDADLVAIADAPGAQPWLPIFEFQSQHDPDKPDVLHLEASVFRCHARDTDRTGGLFQPLPVFVYLKDAGHAVGVSIRTPTGCGYSGDPVLWEVANDAAADTLAKVAANEYSWGALFWVSLMAGGADAEVVRVWQRLRDEKVPPHSRADVTHIALMFAELAGRRPAWNRVLEEVTMTESQVYNEILEQGEMRLARVDLTRVIRLRFPAILTPDVERAIADQPNLRLMRDWLDAAFTVATADELLAVLRR